LSRLTCFLLSYVSRFLLCCLFLNTFFTPHLSSLPCFSCLQCFSTAGLRQIFTVRKTFTSKGILFRITDGKR
jgi:hypothetical protein